MAKKHSYQIKTVLGNNSFTLSAGANESFLVKNIRVYNPTGTHITVRVDRRTVGYYRVSGPLGNHLPFEIGHSRHAHDWTTGSVAAADETDFVGLENAAGTVPHNTMIGGIAVDTTYPQIGGLELAPRSGGKTLLQLLFEREIWRGIPVASGEDLVITGAAQAGAVVIVEYEVYDAGDITPVMPNGSQSNELDYINYGNSGAAITTAAEHLLDTAVNPAEFPDFPFGDDVPANASITLFGILASDLVTADHDGTDGSYTTYLKLFKDQEVLFDEDRNGLLLYGGSQSTAMVIDRVGQGQSVIGNFSDRDYRMPFLLSEPMLIGPGEDMDVYLTIAEDGAGGTVGTDDQEVGFIFRLVRG